MSELELLKYSQMVIATILLFVISCILKAITKVMEREISLHDEQIALDVACIKTATDINSNLIKGEVNG